MRNNKSSAILLIMIMCTFAYGLWSLYDLRFSQGDVYPAYSSLRPDPLGAKAFYESLGMLPDFSVARNFDPIEKMHKGKRTIFLLGEDPHSFEDSGQEDLAAIEKLASGGARVVIAMRPVRRMLATPFPTQTPAKKTDFIPTIESRWGVKFDYQTHTLREFDENPDAMPKLTALFFRSGGKILHRWERKFGSGSVALLANVYPFSNEALETERDLEPIQWALADNKAAIFDETHLGLQDSGSVVGLARKYHLEPVAGALLLLAALFVWRNSSSFLPPRAENAKDQSIEARDARAALTNLLRRNIPVKKLARTCLAEWEKSRFGGHHYADKRLHRIRAAIGADDRAIDVIYREVSGILAERD